MASKPIDHKREINGVLYLAAAVILAVAFYLPAGRSGWLGQILLGGGRGLLGTAALALPVVFVYMAIDYLLERQLRVTRLRFSYVVVLLIAAAALMHLLNVDPAAIQTLSQNSTVGAWQVLRLLWLTGIDPSLFGSAQTTLSGGLLGGGLAMSMLAIAGPIGSLVLIGALILSLIILLFNVSLSGAVGKTAQALNQTRQKVDRAVRDSVAQLRQNRADEAVDRQRYDLLLTEEKPGTAAVAKPVDKHPSAPGAGAAADAAEASLDAEKRPTLLDNLKRLFRPDLVEDGVRGLSAEDLAVPAFLQEDAAATPTQAKGSDNQAGRADGAQALDQTRSAGAVLSQQSAYNLQLGVSEADVSIALPAGIHRVGAAEPPSDQADPAQIVPGAADDAILDQAARDAADSRAHWTDRSAGAPPPVQLLQTRARPGAGTQISLEIPYQRPPLTLLRDDPVLVGRINSQTVHALGQKLERTLESFGIQATVIHVTTGPTITRFELSPGPGVKVSRIVSLADDIALNLAAMGVRIEAPIPGKSAIGIEIPNKETIPVLLRGLLESAEYQLNQAPLTAALGRDIQGAPILCDLAKMPHLLIAGATGSGKSVCINAMLISILYRSSPEDVRMLMIDPKVVELSVYNGIPHLLAPVVTDPKKAANTLLWAVNEMIRRYGLFAEKAVRDINSYQAAARANSSAVSTDNDESEFEHLPLILLVIDELSDLMATTPTEVEDAIARLTAMARAAGIHLVIATQRPSVDVITGVIKANIPSRIAFAVASQVDSRTILDMGGAEKLLGKGDLLYYPTSSSKPIRGQGAFVTDAEVEHVLNFIKTQHTADYDDAVADAIMTAPATASREKDSGDQDELLPHALGIVVEAGYASVSLLQRRMNVGYPRAARLIDRMHEMGYVGPFEGSKPRKILISAAQYLEMKAREAR
jgi:DNA segregation ATPase FtsK/SpoIIIE-like protein